MPFLSALKEKFADIFFLVDSGISVAEFQQVRSILMRLANQLNIGESAYRLGVAQYAQDMKVEFLLNAYQTKEETTGAIKRLRQRRIQPNDPRYLGSALRYASTEFFTIEAGGRADQGYRQYLVVMSGKDSDDSVYKESRLMKAQGVTVVGIGLGASVNEMRVIATPQYVYELQTTPSLVPLLRGIFETEEAVSTTTGDDASLLLLLSLLSGKLADL